jgi:hypothetical protein
MAKPLKDFDCLKMKRTLQAKLQDRWKGLSSEEIVATIRKDLAESDDPFVKRWRRIPTAAQRSAKVDRIGKKASKRKVTKPAR